MPGDKETRGAAAPRTGEVESAWFRSLYEEAVPVVYGYFFKRCGGSSEVAADLTQETFLSALESLRNGAEVEAPMPWVITIARRRLVDHIRRRSRPALRAAEGRDEVWVGPGRTSDREVRLVEALDRLADDRQLALVLRYVDELSVREVAELMGKSVRATESLLVRARAALSESFEALSMRSESDG